jgi:hypothetical protein
MRRKGVVLASSAGKGADGGQSAGHGGDVPPDRAQAPCSFNATKQNDGFNEKRRKKTKENVTREDEI